MKSRQEKIRYKIKKISNKLDVAKIAAYIYQNNKETLESMWRSIFSF